MPRASASLATAPSVLVEPAWLEGCLGEDWVRVIDVRSGGPSREERSATRLRVVGDVDPPRFIEIGSRGGWLRAGPWAAVNDRLPQPFLDGHIPGAVSLDVGGALFDAEGAVVSAPELAMVMSALGVGDEHTVVLVDEGHASAARVAAWVLAHYGHPEARILAGGHPRWLASGRRVTRELVRHPSASFTARVRH